MIKRDFVYTYEYLNRYGRQVVNAILKRIQEDDLIDTGALFRSINYKIDNFTSGTFGITFRIGDGNFVYGSGLPSEYGVYQDQGTIFIDPHYFFTAPIPGLTQQVFLKNLEQAIAKDIQAYQDKQIVELNTLLKQTRKK